jgi:WD40 repeat protein
MLKVYIEDNAFATPRPMEVSANAPVSQLVPALVEELGLPRTDLFGNRLIYVLRHAVDGWVVPDFSSLSAAGIQPETHLALVSYIADEFTVLAAPARQPAGRMPAFYSDQTIADPAGFAALGNSAVYLPSTPYPQPTPTSGNLAPAAPAGGHRWSRRALFLLGGSALGIAGLGLGYAAFRSLANTNPTISTPPTGSQTMATQTTPTAKATVASTPRAVLPTKASMQLVFTQHQQTVHTVNWAPDGISLASGGSDNLLLVWNTTGQVQLRKPQTAAVVATAWSPDSTQLAAAMGKQVLFLNARNGATEMRSTRTHRANVTSLAWSAQQPQFLVSAGLDKLAVVWDTRTFKAQTFFKLHTSGILSAGWSPDGTTVGTSSEGGVIRVWNAANAQQVHGFLFDGAIAMNALAFEPSGTRLAVGGADGILRLWQSGLVCQVEGTGNQNGQCLDQAQHLKGHIGAIHSVAWSPDGRFLASTDSHGQLLLWYPAQSQVPILKITRNAAILAVSWSPDGKKLATASGKTVTLWALN